MPICKGTSPSLGSSGRPQDVALAVLNEHMYDLEAAQQSLSEKADDGGHRPPPKKYEDDLVWEAAGD